MSNGDQFPTPPEQQPQNPVNPYQQQPQYPTYPMQGQPYPPQPAPTYGYSAPQPPAQGGNNRRILIIVGSVLGVLVLACCACVGFTTLANRGSSPNTGAVAGSNQNTTVAATATATSAPSSQHFKVGDHVAVGDTYMVTVNSVKTSQGDAVFKPKSGHTFLIVDVTVKNTSSEEQTLSTLLQFTLKDSTGQKYDETFTADTTPPDGKIATGDQVKGQMAYEVPKSQHDFTLAFEADILSSGQTIWDLHV